LIDVLENVLSREFRKKSLFVMVIPQTAGCSST